MNAELIERSLELVADRHGDPAPLVYARLFAEHPDVEPLFVRDTGGLVRGQMLAMVLDSVLDYVSDDSFAHALVQSERVNHEGLGVPPEIFNTFFAVVTATFKDLLGDDWTDDIASAWREVIDGLSRHAAP